jgi:hypothetical protein
MKYKIALLTIHNANNYGAILQAYASQKVLSRYGEVRTIDYDNKYLSHHLDLIRFSFSTHGIKMLAHDLLRLPYRIQVVSKFKKFVKSNLNLTQKLSSEELMKGEAGHFDMYICGSDQIWNPEIVNPDKQIDPIFFLYFAAKGTKKISYASSIGNHHYTDEEKIEVKKLLQDFTISTRESDGVKKLSEILPDKKISHVLDPTLLLSKDEWLESLNINPEPKEKYILVYSVPRTELIREAVDFYAKKLNIKVVAIDQMLFPLTKVNRHIKNAGPKEFIELYANASFVITDSFHGTCFAINFGKPFVSISAGKRSNRIVSLLSLLDLDERLVSKEEELKKISFEIDVKQVLKKLENAKNYSKRFLKDHLSQ